MAQVVSAFSWYLLLAALGWLAFPIAYRFLGALPDRGYAFARPLGLLLWGFIFWILSSYGLLQNTPAGLITAALVLAAIAFWAGRQLPRGAMRQWLRSNRSTVVAVELLFAVAFIFMAFIRAARPEIFHTEQPMELAFINAILRSPSMPPHDPWLSGFSISYYYFGYLMMAMLAKMIGVIGSVAFNLGFVSIFAMAATGAYGLAHNLLRLLLPKARRAILWLALLAPVFVLLLGNLEGVLEIAHSRQLFWKADASGAQTSSFWAWLDIQDLVNPPVGEPSWAPRMYRTGWWWWRASRVISDKTFTGGPQELIDEMPAFSFTLGDLHPHVLSMPFVMLAAGLALNLYLDGAERKEPLPLLGLKIREEYLLFSAVLLGGLAFLNIWDFPIYVGLFALAYLLRQAQTSGWTWPRIPEFFALGLTLGISGILIYLPFYLGFKSQAGGILPNLLNPTRGVQLWVMFAIPLLILFTFLLTRWREEKQGSRLLKNFLIGFGFVAGFWLFSLAISWLYAALFGGDGLGEVIRSGLGAPDLGSLFDESIRRRLAAWGGWLTLSILLGLVLGLLYKPSSRPEKKNLTTEDRGRSFIFLLALVGTLLVIAPEFIYLRDHFGTRMNTVFKFYFQTWQMWGVAAAVMPVVLLNQLRGLRRAAFAGLLIVLIGAGSIYPFYSFSDVTSNPVYSLDGASYLSADAIEAIEWLRSAPLGPLVEAVGGSYDANYARYSTHSGQTGLLGWPGHELQWRGSNPDPAREGDIEILYTTSDWLTAQSIISKYGIRFIVIGDVERNRYALSEEKFTEHLELAFQNDTVSIYQVP